MAKSTKAAGAPKPPASANVIRILKPPKDAFNQNRPVSDLLWTQVEHLAAVVKREIDDRARTEKRDIDIRKFAIRTEGQASAFVQEMTRLLQSLNDKDS